MRRSRIEQTPSGWYLSATRLPDDCSQPHSEGSGFGAPYPGFRSCGYTTGGYVVHDHEKFPHRPGHADAWVYETSPQDGAPGYVPFDPLIHGKQYKHFAVGQIVPEQGTVMSTAVHDHEGRVERGAPWEIEVVHRNRLDTDPPLPRSLQAHVVGI